MGGNEVAQQSFTRLVTEGRGLLRNDPTDVAYTRFRTEAMNLVRRVCGQHSDHYIELKRFAEGKESAANTYFFGHCLGILEAAQRDFENGLLFDLRSLISAEVLGDFMEQAYTL